MKTESVLPVRLKDYTPPAYLVDEVSLEVTLVPQRTRVRATLSMRPNPKNKGRSRALVLDGEMLDLVGLSLDGFSLGHDDYEVSDEALTIFSPPKKPFTLFVETFCDPDANKALSGLYRSSNTYCTQCEAEGFRRITYYPDRPDVLAKFTTRIEARKSEAPILLSNGNLVEYGDVEDTERHYAVWHDPHPKPCYLFALVGGKLACVENLFTTMSGRKVALKIYVEPGKQDRADYAMDALKRSMRWDEEKFGREYDLDIFMIVAVSDFNMGAMENKGLNIFNDKYVLARPDTATDVDYAGIEAVIAHEYFHNWTGNRITCRDWFQLCLKEGLTVFRDQEFSADMRSRTVQRIDDVRRLLNQQFPEDAGPLAHPVRPTSYFEINNFYTATVYEKGAEVIRMLKTLIGDNNFRKGMDLYFKRHDGDAATVEDFLQVMKDASGVDLKQFMRWYTQAGTPELTVATKYDANAKRFELTATQFCPPTPGQSSKAPFHIPLKLGLADKTGDPIAIHSKSLVKGSDDVVAITKREQRFIFTNVNSKPTPSLLRGFSAPVKLTSSLKEKDLLFLMAHDDDAFNRWQAGQAYASLLLKRMVRDFAKGTPLRRGGRLAEALKVILEDETLEPAFKAQCLELPSLSDLARDIAKNVNPEALHTVRNHLRSALSDTLEDTLVAIFNSLKTDKTYVPDAASAGVRSLRNGVLALLAETGKAKYLTLVSTQFKTAHNMTDTIAALSILTHKHGQARKAAFDGFYKEWKNDPLVLDKWFMLQAVSTHKNTLKEIKRLKQDPAFNMKNPNRVRALIGTFAAVNLARFHDQAGKGYEFVADAVLELDQDNPQVAARLAGAFKNWRAMETMRRNGMKAELKRILAHEGLSRDTSEIVSKSLS